MKILQVGQFIRGIPGGATMDVVLEFMEGPGRLIADRDSGIPTSVRLDPVASR